MKLLGFSLLLIVSFLFSACSKVVAPTVMEGPSYGNAVSEKDIRYSGIRMNSVAIIDKNLQRTIVSRDMSGVVKKKTFTKLAVEASGSKYNETGTLKTWATFRNRTDHRIQLLCRVSFFDEYKMRTEGPSKWERIIIEPNSIESFKANSLKFSEIKYYYIEVKEGD
jgi:hypothetical protein